MSPAWPWSSVFWNISTPVTTEFLLASKPTISTGVADLDRAALDPAGADRAAALDREDVLDRHQERLVDRADRLGDVLVHRLDQVEDRLGRLGVGRVLERRAAAAADDRDLVAGELVLGQQLAELQLDQLEQLLVVDQVDLVEEDDQGGHADLAGQQDVLAGLGHRAVGRRDDQDRAVHLGGAGDHVLDVVGVARAVDVGVVPLLALVLDVRDGDGDRLGRVADGAALGDVGVRLRLGLALARPAPPGSRPSGSSCRGRCGRSCRR